MKRSTPLAVGTVTTLALVRVSLGDAVFHAWIEAPEAIDAGSSFTASLWLGVSGSVLHEGYGAVYGYSLDLMASGISASFSEAVLFTPGTSVGTPAPNSLRGVVGFNHPAISPFSAANPLRLLTTEVTTEPNVTGTLEINVSQLDGWSFIFSWWIDYATGSYVFDTDLGSTRVVTPAVVRVIPPAPGASLLALGVAALPRRRQLPGSPR